MNKKYFALVAFEELLQRLNLPQVEFSSFYYFTLTATDALTEPAEFVAVIE